jgi:hypothetical protein
VVKLGTITPQGADVFSYAPDEVHTFCKLGFLLLFAACVSGPICRPTATRQSLPNAANAAISEPHSSYS